MAEGADSSSSSRADGGARADEARPRLVIVGRVHRLISPRIQRLRRVAEPLERLGWECVRWPDEQAPSASEDVRSRPVRRTARKLAERTILLDRFEPASVRGRKRLRELRPDAGYLVGPPFSYAAAAARELRERGRPYVVDSGDPWALEGRLEGGGRLVNARREASEAQLLGGAAGVVLTTELQAAEVESKHPGIPILVRTGGYQEVGPMPAGRPIERDPRVLRLVHFGRFDSSVRVDPMPLLVDLAESGRWRKIVLTQFGPDVAQLPGSGRSDVTIEARDALPWPEAVTEAANHDAAIVIGNLPERAMQMPSKVIEYLGLSVPRLALCSGPDDSLHRFAGRLPGYLVVDDGDRRIDRVIAHLGRDWSPEELAPPPEYSWAVVAARIAEFVDACLRMPGPGVAVPVGGVEATA